MPKIKPLNLPLAPSNQQLSTFFAAIAASPPRKKQKLLIGNNKDLNEMDKPNNDLIINSNRNISAVQINSKISKSEIDDTEESEVENEDESSSCLTVINTNNSNHANNIHIESKQAKSISNDNKQNSIQPNRDGNESKSSSNQSNAKETDTKYKPTPKYKKWMSIITNKNNENCKLAAKVCNFNKEDDCIDCNCGAKIWMGCNKVVKLYICFFFCYICFFC